MFSNQIKSQELYLYNPMSHFFGSGSQAKSTAESGFSSSSENQSRNAKENYSLPNSDDVFSKSPKIDACNIDYKKYVSQNLILDPVEKSPNVLYEVKEYHDKKKASKTDCSYVVKEISGLHENLQVDIKEINSNISATKSYFEEVKKTIEDLKDTQNIQGNILKVIGETNKNLENGLQVLQDKISENAKTVKCIESKMDKYFNEVTDKLEKTKKSFVAAIENNTECIEKELRSMTCQLCSEFHNSIIDVKNRFEINLEEKFQMMKNIVSLRNSQHFDRTNQFQPPRFLSRQEDFVVDKLRICEKFPSLSKSKYGNNFRFSDSRLRMSRKTFPPPLSNQYIQILENHITSSDSSPEHEVFQNNNFRNYSSNCFLMGKDNSLVNAGKKNIRHNENELSMPITQKRVTGTHRMNKITSNKQETPYKAKLRSTKFPCLNIEKKTTLPKSNKNKRSKDNCTQDLQIIQETEIQNKKPIKRRLNYRNKKNLRNEKHVLKKHNYNSLSVSFGSPSLTVLEAVDLSKNRYCFDHLQ